MSEEAAAVAVPAEAPVQAPPAVLSESQPTSVVPPQGLVAEQPSAQPAAVPVAPSVSLPENWKEALPEDIRNDPGLQTTHDIATLAKGYVNLQKQLGSDKVVLPTKHATEDDWKSFYHKIGLPEKLESYELAAPKESRFDDGFLTEMKKVFHEGNVLPRQANFILEKYHALNEQALAKHEEQTQAVVAERLGALKKEYGAAYEQKVSQARAVLKQFGDDQTWSWLEESGLGNDDRLIKLLVSIGGALGEDQLPVEGNDPSVVAPGDAKKQVDEILNNREHPYWNKNHANHGAAKKEVERLHQLLHPEPGLS